MKTNKKMIIAFSFIGLLSINILNSAAGGVADVLITPNTVATNPVDAANTNIILNLTGKLIELHFHSKINKMADLHTPLRPLMISGAPITGIEAVTTRMLPQPVNMHKMSCHSVTASLGNGKKTKHDKIEPCTIKIPAMKTLNDYKLTIEQNTDGKPRLIFTKCDSIRLIPLHKGANKQDLSRAKSNTYVSKTPITRSNATTPEITSTVANTTINNRNTTYVSSEKPASTQSTVAAPMTTAPIQPVAAPMTTAPIQPVAAAAQTGPQVAVTSSSIAPVSTAAATNTNAVSAANNVNANSNSASGSGN